MLHRFFIKLILILFLISIYCYSTSKLIIIADLEESQINNESRWIGTAITESLRLKMSYTNDYYLINYSEIKQILKEINITGADLYHKKSALKAGKYLGAKYIITGKINKHQHELKVNIKVFDRVHGKIIQSFSTIGNINNLFELENKLFTQLINICGIILNNKEKNDVYKIPTSNMEAYKYYNTGNILYADKSIDLAILCFETVLKIDPDFTDALFSLGNIYQNKEMYLQSMSYYFQARAKYMVDNNDLKLAEIYNNLGNIYYKECLYDTAIKYHNMALLIYQNRNKVFEISQTLYDIAYSYNYSGQFNTAIEFHNKSAEVCKSYGNDILLAKNYSLIAFICRRDNNYNKAIEYNKKSLAINVKRGAYYWIARNYDKIGYSYKLMKNYDSAIQYYSAAIKIHKKLNNLENCADDYFKIASIYDYYKIDYDSALDYYLKALPIFILNKKYPDIKNCFDNSIGIYNKITSDYFSEFEYYPPIEDVIQAFKEDTNNSRLRLCKNYIQAKIYIMNQEYDTGLQYYIKWTELLQKIDNSSWITKLWRKIKFYLFFWGKNTKYLKKCKQLIKLSSDYPEYEIPLYISIGKLYIIHYEYNKAINVFKSHTK